MEEIPCITSEKGETIEIVNFNPIQIEQNEIIYELNIKSEENAIIFSIRDKSIFPSVNYIRKMNLKKIKDLNVTFSLFNSFNNFYDYLKSLSDNKKLNIKKCYDKISIIFYVEVLLKQQLVEIDLFPTKKDINLNINEIFQELSNINLKIDDLKKDNDSLNKRADYLKNENKELNSKINNINNENKRLNEEIVILKNENKELKYQIEKQNKEINYLKEEIKNDIKSFKEELKYNKSKIMEKSEKKFILSEIENKMKKQIKELKKLYQATIDGGDPKIFHDKCDNIPNTLVLIKSEGKRRFGGFTPLPWKSKGDYVEDSAMKTFVFSLDNKKIYNLKFPKFAVLHNVNNGPCFGCGFDVGIEGNPIKENKLYTCQCSYDYKRDNHALSEYENPNKLRAIEYEVFQVIFN